MPQVEINNKILLPSLSTTNGVTRDAPNWNYSKPNQCEYLSRLEFLENNSYEKNYLHGTNNNNSNIGVQIRAGSFKDVSHVEKDGVDTTELLEEYQRARYVERLEITASEYVCNLDNEN